MLRCVTSNNWYSTCYVLGGHHTYFNQALFASVDDLINLQCCTSQAYHQLQCGYKQSAYSVSLEDTTQHYSNIYDPAAAVLAGNLIAIGGIKGNIVIWRS